MTHLTRRFQLVACALAVLAVVAGVATARTALTAQEVANATPPATPDALGSPVATPSAEVEIELKDFMFIPDEITVGVGTTITWTNRDPVAHTADAADDPQTFDSGNIAPGQTFQHTFDEPGTIDYICIYHGNMKGTIVVE